DRHGSLPRSLTRGASPRALTPRRTRVKAPAMPGPRGHASVIAAILLAAAPPARADERACGAGRPWSGMSFSGDVTESFRQSVLQDVRAGLSSHGIAVCRSLPDRTASALAVIHLSARSDANVGVSVEVRDAVTRKRV